MGKLCNFILFVWLGLSQRGSTLSVVFTGSDCQAAKHITPVYWFKFVHVV